jgi:hypothetical protein
MCVYVCGVVLQTIMCVYASGVCCPAGNHPLDPDAFHPMTFSSVKLPGSSRSQGLLLSTPPDPAWLNEGDCADKAWNLT